MREKTLISDQNARNRHKTWITSSQNITKRPSAKTVSQQGQEISLFGL